MSFDRVKFVEPQPEKTEKTPKQASVFRPRVVEKPTPAPETAMPQEESMVNGLSQRMIIGVVAGVIFLGLATGYGAARLTASTGTSYEVETASTPEEVENKIQAGAIFGVPDEKTFRDDAEGVLIQGGLDGEGSHTLLRPGGVSQNVYLTSSVVDLDQFANMRVRVWGETFKGQKAGWLMDVGRLEVKELAAEKPDWYSEE